MQQLYGVGRSVMAEDAPSHAKKVGTVVSGGSGFGSTPALPPKQAKSLLSLVGDDFASFTHFIGRFLVIVTNVSFNQFSCEVQLV